MSHKINYTVISEKHIKFSWFIYQIGIVVNYFVWTTWFWFYMVMYNNLY